MSPKRVWLGLSLACLLSTGGCQCWNCNPRGCPDIELGAMPMRPGWFTEQWRGTQSQKARLDRFVIHQYEWRLGGATLGPDGKRHMDWLVKSLPEVTSEQPAPICIADSDDEQLNDDRKAAVVAELAARGVPDAESLVVIGVPQAEGLYGQEAVRAGTMRQLGGGMGMGGQGGLGGGMGMGGLGAGGLGGGQAGGLGGGLGGGGGGFGGGGFF